MINTKYQGCANQYLHFARDVSSELARTITRRTFSCLTFYDGSKDPAVSHAPSRKISTTNIDNKINGSDVRKSSFPQVIKSKANFKDYPFNKIITRQLWHTRSDPGDSGHGPSWPSRLGRVKVKRQRKGGVDVLEDNDDDKIRSKEVIDKVNAQISHHTYGRLFAVVLMEKHQHKITSGDLLMCNHDIGASLGQVIKLDKSLLIGGKDFTLIGRPLLPRDAFQIMATVVEKNLSQHKICYRHLKRVKSNNPKTRWHRDFTTTLRINSIELIKPVDKTVDRAGFEPPLNKNPLNGY